jgi:serine acetyltransferase
VSANSAALADVPEDSIVFGVPGKVSSRAVIAECIERSSEK